MVLNMVGSGGSGGGVIEPLTITANGIYTAPQGVDGYSPVTANVFVDNTAFVMIPAFAPHYDIVTITEV